MKTSVNRGFDRNQYGALIWHGDQVQKTLIHAEKLIKRAIKSKLLEAEYIDTDKKGLGDCLNYDVYDCKRGAALVQRRHTMIDKYGNHPQKDYFLIQSNGSKKPNVSRVNHKNMIVKWSKRAKKLGDIIRADSGLIKIETGNKTEFGYKALAKNEAGGYVSVWDGSTWRLNKERVEKATKNHTGGFYYYKTLAQCRAAALDNDIFGSCREHSNLFIVRVRISGARYNVFDNKYCASKLTPLKLVEKFGLCGGVS